MTVHENQMEKKVSTLQEAASLSEYLDGKQNSVIAGKPSLDENEMLVAALLEMSPFIMSITTLGEGRFLRINTLWCKIMGLREEDVIGRTFEDLGIAIDPAERKKMVAAINAHGEIKDYVTHVRPGNSPSYDTRMWLKKIRYQGRDCLLSMITYSSALTQSMQAAHQSEKRFRNILNSIHESYYEVDLNGNIMVFNNSASELFGRSAQELPGMNFRDYAVPDDLPKVIQAYKEVYQGKCAVNLVEYGIYHKDGTRMQVETSASLLRDNNGKPIGYYGIIRDRTKQKAAEDALRRSEEKYRGILEEMEEGYYEVDLKGNYTYFNKAVRRMHGRNEEDLKGVGYRQYLTPEQAEKNISIFVEIYRTGKPQKLNAFEATRKDGSKLFAEVSAYPLRDTDGKIIGFWGISRDRTEEKKAELALQKSEEQYRLLVNNASDGIFITQKGRIQYYNPRTLKITGYPDQELMGLLFADLVHPEDRIGIYDVEARKIQVGDAPEIFAFRIKNRKKETLWVELSAIGITWEGEAAVLNFMRDVTHQRRIESQLMQSQKMEAIGTLAGGIAHDFNNILASIVGFTELVLEDVAADSLLADNLKEVMVASKRAKDLVHQILTFARRSEEKMEPVVVSTIAKEALRLIRASLPTTITIERNIASDALILGNPTQVHQIIMNLCTNAAHAMEESGGVLSLDIANVHLSPQDAKTQFNLEGGDYLTLSVSDTGCGMPADILDTIFEPYFTTKGPGQGTGMGLSVVQGIVENYGGKISVRSEVGKGTTFTIYLPISNEREAAECEQAETTRSFGERILLIDDELPILNMGNQILSRLGYKVTTQSSSLSALKLFQSQPGDFDLVITDMTMPQMTGDRLAEEMMKIRANIPIVLCTGYSNQITEEKAAQMGIKALIYKPLVKKDYTAVIREVLDRSAGKDRTVFS